MEPGAGRHGRSNIARLTPSERQRLLGLMPLPLARGTYDLDVTHSQIGFTVLHLGLTPVRGLFAEFSGQLTVGDTADESELEVTIGLPSLQSSHPGREEHLQGEDFFHSAQHPQMSFRSTRIEGAEAAWTVTGDLSLRGVTRPVTIDTRMTGRALFPLDQKEHIGFVASGVLSRTAFGVAPNVPSMMLSDDITVELAVQLILQ